MKVELFCYFSLFITWNLYTLNVITFLYPSHQVLKYPFATFHDLVYYWKWSEQGVQEWFLGQMWEQSWRQDQNWINEGKGWKFQLEGAAESFEKIGQRTGKMGTGRWAGEVAAQLHGQNCYTVQNCYKA